METCIEWWPTDLPDSMEPLALALTAHFESQTSQVVEFQRSDGEHYTQSSDDYFTAPNYLEELETAAIDIARGPVLDVGAACGRLTLKLQQEQHQVTALDVSATMTALMEQRGVQETLTGDVFDILSNQASNSLPAWSTTYLLMETVGMVGTIERLGELLVLLHSVMGADAQVVLDSSPLFETGDTCSVTLQMRFKTQSGPPFQWLYLDSTTLATIADTTGWETELGYLDEDSGHYLARLRRA